MATALLRETKGALSADEIEALNVAHTEAYGQRRDTVRPLPGARDLLTTLTDHRVPWAIATSGLAIAARPALQLLGLPPDTPLITRDEVRFAKPDRTCFSPPQRGLAPTSARRSSSATASGICSPLDGLELSGLACFLAATAVRSLSVRAHTGSMPTPLISSCVLDEVGVRRDAR